LKNLEINTPQGAEILTDIVTMEILKDVGGELGDDLVTAYIEKFAKKSYIS